MAKSTNTRLHSSTAKQVSAARSEACAVARAYFMMIESGHLGCRHYIESSPADLSIRFCIVSAEDLFLLERACQFPG